MAGPARDKAARQRVKISAQLTGKLDRKLASADEDVRKLARKIAEERAASGATGKLSDEDRARVRREVGAIMRKTRGELLDHAQRTVGTIGQHAALSTVAVLRQNGVRARRGWSRKDQAEAIRDVRGHGIDAVTALKVDTVRRVAKALEHPTPLLVSRLQINRAIPQGLDRRVQRIVENRAQVDVAEANGVRRFIHTGPIDGNNHPDSMIYLGAVMTRDEWLLVDPFVFDGGLHPNERGTLEPIDPEFSRIADKPALERAIRTGDPYRSTDYFTPQQLRQADRPLRPDEALRRGGRRATPRAAQRTRQIRAEQAQRVREATTRRRALTARRLRDRD